jgi:hypothetical protein
VIGVVIILAHASDAGAALVAEWLAARVGPQAIRIVRPESLTFAVWSQRVDRHGRMTSRVEWPSREAVEDSQVGAVLNRIRYLPVPRFRRSCAKDRDYAAAEFHAVVTGWLGQFGERAVHVVRRHPLLTPVLPLQHWASAAAACNLPVRARIIASSARALRWQVCRASGAQNARWTSEVVDGTVLVAGNQTGGTLAHRYGVHCVETARALRAPLLEFRFASNGTEEVLVDVDPLPPLTQRWAAGLTGQLLASIAAEARP